MMPLFCQRVSARKFHTTSVDVFEEVEGLRAAGTVEGQGEQKGGVGSGGGRLLRLYDAMRSGRAYGG